MKNIIKTIGLVIVALFLFLSSAQAAVVTVTMDPGNSPANPILNSSSGSLASGYVQVIDTTDTSVSTPSASTGLPLSANAVVRATGNLSAAGTFIKSGVSIATGHYLYLVAWDTWTGTGTPSGNYGVSAISVMMTGVSYIFRPASFKVNIPLSNNPTTSIVIDDIEGTDVLPTNYYVFASSTPANPTIKRITTPLSDIYQGNYSMQTTYPVISDSNSANWWRGWGGTRVSTIDVSGYDTLSFWMKGDGSSNTVKFQVKDAKGNNFVLADAYAVSLSNNTGWVNYLVPGFKSKMVRVPNSTTGDGVIDWKNITDYQFVFTGTAASGGVLIDYITVTNAGGGSTPHITGITPTSGLERTVITITGSNFTTGGEVNFSGGGSITSVQSAASGSLVTSWTDSQITLSVPGMSSGSKTVNLVRTDGVASDNSVTFNVTASGTESAGGSYNYPNPFNPKGGEITTITFNPGTATNGNVRIFDMTAREVARRDWFAGTPQVQWDGKNQYGEIVGDGVYLYRIVDGGNGKLISKGKILVINR